MSEKLWSASEVWGTVPYNDLKNEADERKWFPVEKVKKAIAEARIKTSEKVQSESTEVIVDVFQRFIEKELGLSEKEIVEK